MRNKMKKAVLMILTLLLLLVPVTVYADTTCIVTGTRNYLALRTEPRTSESNEIGKLYNGETFYVTNSGYNSFAYGYTTRGQYGYVNATYLRVANSQPAPNYQPAPGYQSAPSYQPAPSIQQTGGSARTVAGTKNYLRFAAVRSGPTIMRSEDCTTVILST